MESTDLRLRRKQPWELHAIVCLVVVTIGYGISEHSRGYLENHHYFMAAGLIACFIGLFRGSPVAWWATVVAFSISTIASGIESGSFLARYGFRVHQLLFKAHGMALLCLTVTGLLILCRIRGAYPARSRPVMEELVLFARVAGVAGPILSILAAFFSMTLVLLFSTGRGSSERYSSGSLKTLTSAEADFRANDRDWNRVNDFWVGDVAGLYCLLPKEPANSPMIKLIELSMAAADGDPLKASYPPIPTDPGHKAGTWYQALESDRSTTPPTPYWVDHQPYNTSKFGFIAYPDDFIAGQKYAFMVNEDNTVFRRRLNDDIKASDRIPPGRMKLDGFRDWPSDDELKAHWSKLD